MFNANYQLYASFLAYCMSDTGDSSNNTHS